VRVQHMAIVLSRFGNPQFDSPSGRPFLYFMRSYPTPRTRASAADRAEHATMPLVVWGGPGVGGPPIGHG
jgi:hypothetical protein